MRELNKHEESVILVAENDSAIAVPIHDLVREKPRSRLIHRVWIHLRHYRGRLLREAEARGTEVNWRMVATELVRRACDTDTDKFIHILRADNQDEYAQSLEDNTYQSTKPITEKETMNTPLYETKQFISGVDVTVMSDEDLINKIGELEGKVADLEKIKTKSTAITAKIKALKAGIKNVVAVLDGRQPKPARKVAAKKDEAPAAE